MSTQHMLPGTSAILIAAPEKEVAITLTWVVPAGTSTTYSVTADEKAGDRVALAFLKPSDLVWSTSPPSVRGIWASTCSGGDGRRERMSSARDRRRGARVGVARGSAGKETHVQEVEDGSHGVGWGAAMSPERSHGVKRRDGGSALLFLRAACLARVLPLLARVARISKRTPQIQSQKISEKT